MTSATKIPVALPSTKKRRTVRPITTSDLHQDLVLSNHPIGFFQQRHYRCQTIWRRLGSGTDGDARQECPPTLLHCHAKAQESLSAAPGISQAATHGPKQMLSKHP